MRENESGNMEESKERPQSGEMTDVSVAAASNC